MPSNALTCTAKFDPINSAVSGDVSNDNNVDLADAILALRIIAGIPVEEYINPNADANGDGKIGTEEVIFILRKVAGFR